jgi:hypothetical protein
VQLVQRCLSLLVFLFESVRYLIGERPLDSVVCVSIVIMEGDVKKFIDPNLNIAIRFSGVSTLDLYLGLVAVKHSNWSKNIRHFISLEAL